MRYSVRYVHKISPRDTDTAKSIVLSDDDIGSKNALGAALRREKIIHKGERLRLSRVEKDGKVIAWPAASIWWSIIMTPIGENPRMSNPLIGDLVVGVGLLALGAYALYKLSSVVHLPSSSTAGQAIGFTPADVNTLTPVAIGDSVTFSLPQSAGQTWQAVMSGDAILSSTPTTQTSSSGVSETYTVVGAGQATVAYQLMDASGNPSGTPLDFELTTASATPSV